MQSSIFTKVSMTAKDKPSTSASAVAIAYLFTFDTNLILASSSPVFGAPFEMKKI